MTYKLVCIDVDGTLLNKKGKVSSQTIKSIKLAHEKGVEVVITTGRNFTNASYYSDLVGVNSAVIAANGAFIREKKSDRAIFKHELGEELCLKILKVASKHKIDIDFHTPDSIYCSSVLHELVGKFVMSLGKPKDRKVKFANVANFREWETIFKNNFDRVVKCIMINLNKDKIRLLKEELKTIDGLEVISSGKYNVEVIRKGTSKGIAVEHISKYYNIKREEIIAIGDNENDISMIEYAGLGVAMGNAIDILKDKADFVTDTNNNDGVSKVIQRFILNEL